jgi:hypothetical protein
MKNKNLSIFLLLIIPLLMFSFAVTSVSAKTAGLPRGTKVVWVWGQDKYYDTIVPITPDKQLPWKGPFQLLEEVGPTGLQTEFGLGDQEYVGGRWWIDANGNEEQDAEDVYFLCPLLGPGRDEP